MRRKIRKNVFETNSSSMHSIVVTKNDIKYTEEEINKEFWVQDDGRIKLYSSEVRFGRYPFAILSTMKDKARYVMAALCCRKDDDAYQEIVAIIKKYIPEFVDFELEKETNLHNPHYYTEKDMKTLFEGYAKFGDEYVSWNYKFGQIDHQSGDVLPSFLEEKGVSLEEFLTNRKYIIVIDGDEYCVFESMKENGLIDMDNIVEEFGTEECHPYEYYHGDEEASDEE